MNSKRISLIFVILLLGLLLIPILYLQFPYGYGVGWVWGFVGSYFSFEPIWVAFQTGFLSMDLMYYLALAAVIGIVVDVVLIIISIKATAHRWFILLIAILNIGFGASAILVATTYNILSGSLFITPSAIFVVIWAGFIIYQIRKS